MLVFDILSSLIIIGKYYNKCKRNHFYVLVLPRYLFISLAERAQDKRERTVKKMTVCCNLFIYDLLAIKSVLILFLCSQSLNNHPFPSAVNP